MVNHDSGYVSDLQLTSSIQRPTGSHPNVTTGYVAKSGKRMARTGRAEAAIARLRQSPLDRSPSLGRHPNLPAYSGMMPPPISSPVRLSSPVHAPFTPAQQRLSRPQIPVPASPSPETQLQNFRANVSQPYHTTPADWPETPNVRNTDYGSPMFRIYNDTPSQQLTPVDNSSMGMSPLTSVRQSTTRPQFGRTITSTNALHEIQGKPASRLFNAALHETPSKMPNINRPLSAGANRAKGSPLKKIQMLGAEVGSGDENDFDYFFNLQEQEAAEQEVTFEPDAGFGLVRSGSTSSSTLPR
ncbi:uncharacterized protein AB675_9119 [Cyphellophora attinorum]|uniref:Uncharacterized protein n=1 Tax=Cyphellophora attinorum TaxID=1664694 RepID=A0A0N1NZU5_9EURO|nr:uncharacterized protein AB675_9119 [Phialophora attinorum]KPI41580.1 hypothetical protein AB675_9119 [Phialophora attinorum]